MTTREAAARLGVSRSRINKLIHTGQLKAAKSGRDWIITEANLKKASISSPGRPKKA